MKGSSSSGAGMAPPFNSSDGPGPVDTGFHRAFRTPVQQRIGGKYARFYLLIQRLEVRAGYGRFTVRTNLSLDLIPSASTARMRPLSAIPKWNATARPFP